MFEVRSECPQDGSHCPEGFIPETRRYLRDVAEEDVELLKLFGKKAWIVEL